MAQTQIAEESRKIAKCLPWLFLFEFFQIFNGNVFNLVSPSVAKGFGITPSSVSLVLTVFQLCVGIAGIVYMSLTDMISVRKLILFTSTAFPLVSLLGVFSHYSFILLIICQILFALTVVGPASLVIIIIVRYFDKLTAAKYLGYNTAIFQLASMAGHFFGGYIVEYLHWSMTFLFPVVTAIGLPILFKNLPKDEGKKGSFDFLSIALIMIIVGSLMTYMTFKMKYPLLMFSFIVFIAILAIYTLKSKNPLVKPELFKVKGIIWALLSCALFYGTQLGFTFIFPFIITDTYGMSITKIGVFYTLVSIAAFIGGVSSGRIIRMIGARNIVLLSGFTILFGLALIAFLVGYSVVYVFIGMGLFNLGYALLYSGFLTGYTQLIPVDQRGVGLGFEKMVMSVSQSLGGALMAMLYGQGFMMTRIVDFFANEKSVQYSNSSLVLIIMVALATLIFALVFNKRDNHVEMSKGGSQFTVENH